VYIDQATDTAKSRPSQCLLAVQKKVKRMGARCGSEIGMSTESTPSVVPEEGVSFDGPPVIVRPAQPERSMRLNAQHITVLHASRLPGKLPDFEQLMVVPLA
jgi:hypothetical protein